MNYEQLTAASVAAAAAAATATPSPAIHLTGQKRHTFLNHIKILPPYHIFLINKPDLQQNYRYFEHPISK